MFELIFLLWSLSDFSTQPTREQIELIQKLGDDSYDTRELSQNKLQKMEDKAKVALNLYGLNNQDIEIRKRSELLIDELYRFDQKIPPCTTLHNRSYILLKNKKLELPPNSAVFWFELAGGNNSYEISDEIKRGQATRATELFLKHLRNSGYSKEDTETILTKLNSDNRMLQWQSLYTELRD